MRNILWSDQSFVSHRANLDGVLSQPVEEFSSGGRLSSIKSEDKLVEVVVEVLGSHGTLMRSHQPAFEQRDRPVDPWEQMFPRGAAALNSPMMHEAVHLSVGVEPVGAYRASRFDRGSDESMEGGAVEIRDPGHANASDASSVLLSGHCDQRFGVGQAAGSPTGFGSAPVGFINFHDTAQTFTSGPHHRLAQFVEDKPGGLVAAQAQHPLKAQGTHPVLLAGDVPHRPEPNGQRKMGVLKHGPRQDRNLLAAAATQPEPAGDGPCLLPVATRAPKPVRPAKVHKILPTRLIVGETLLKLYQRARIVFGHARPLNLGVG